MTAIAAPVGGLTKTVFLLLRNISEQLQSIGLERDRKERIEMEGLRRPIFSFSCF